MEERFNEFTEISSKSEYFAISRYDHLWREAFLLLYGTIGNTVESI